MSLKKKGDEITPSIQKIMEATKQSFDEISTQPRFGFFSIPPNQIIGDRFYSINKEYNHKVVDRTVITEKRGIYTTIVKSGKGHDAYFQSFDTTDEGVQKRLMEGWKQDKKAHLEKIAELKVNGHYTDLSVVDKELIPEIIETNSMVKEEKPLLKTLSLN